MLPSSTDVFALFDSLGAVTFAIDPVTLDIRFFGSGVRELLGLAPDAQCEGSSFWKELIPAGELSSVLGTLQSVAVDGTCRTFEHRARVPHRGEVWFRTRVQRSDSSPCLVGVMHDISTARHTERQCRENEQWLVTLGETLPFDFWICDLEGRYLLQNPVSIRRLGNALGRRSVELGLPAEAQRRWQHSFTRALAGETVHERLESQVDGERRFFARVLSPLGQGPEINGVLGVDIDITQLTQSEERLRQSLEDLGLAQETLVRREQLAALGEMAALIAHEVRNPLGSIANAVTLLRRGNPLSAPDSGLWEVIKDEVQRLDQLVSNLLDFVRPSVPKFSPRSLESVVEGALLLSLRTEEASDRIEIVRNVEAGLPLVSIDGPLLEVALTNVFRNAMQAMAGTGHLHVAIGREERADTQWARITIRDSGCGIVPEVRKRIFEPFVTTRARGYGLGLTIVKKVLDLHLGEVDLQSELGQGTTCVLRLPILRKVG